jgi:IclR family mhp operon transcriptional activator
MSGDKVLATVGMTYFISAIDRRELLKTFLPRLQTLAENISRSAAALKAIDFPHQPRAAPD